MMHNLEKNLDSSDNEITKEKIILNHLYYILCGIDTEYLSIGLKDKKYALVVDKNYPYEYLKPFESLCINVRIIHKFIIKGLASSQYIKKTISEFFLDNMKNFLTKISEIRHKVKDIESLYVKIEEDIRLFEEFRYIIDNSRNKEDVEIYTFIKTTCKNDSYITLVQDCYRIIESLIFDWITQGTLSYNFMIKDCKYNVENIENGFWKSKYELNKKQIPDDFSNDADIILQCGKLINLNRNLDHIINIEKNFVIERGIYGVYAHLQDTTYTLLGRELNNELIILEKFVLMNDMSFYNDLFIDLYNDKSFNISNDFSVLSSENKKFLLKVNLFKKIDLIKFKMAEFDLNNTIYKILDTNLQLKNNQSILEFLTIEFKPRILSYIITKRNFLELELIFRFIFTLSVIQFFLQRCYKYRFSKLVLHFIHNFKFSIYRDAKNIKYTSIDTLVNEITNVILKYLNSLFLISSEIYLIISEIIDLSFNFISLDKKDECINLEDFEDKFVNIICKLYEKVKKTNCDWWFINTLECLMNENFMRKREI